MWGAAPSAAGATGVPIYDIVANANNANATELNGGP